MKILAVETSCDETSVSVLKAKGRNFNLLSNIVASQVKIHARWGGVVPNLAKREHQKNLVPILTRALRESKLLKEKGEIKSIKSQFKNQGELYNILEREPELLKKLLPFFKKYRVPNIDLIAVTQGPGLEPALWVGINFAKALAYFWQKPLIGINHLEGHMMSVFLPQNSFSKQFPALALVVSGGHTELVLIKKWLNYKVIGQTLDDAAGEAFDKVAKMLKLGYPGGPAISLMADKKIKSASHNKIKLPRPMINSKDYNFSFSGLKTAVLYLVRDLEKETPDFYRHKDIISAICAEFQQAAIDVLIFKTMRAAKEYRVKTIILGGGVAANKELREKLKKAIEEINKGRDKNINLLMPKMEFTGDNAAMIALSAYLQSSKKPSSKKIIANSSLNL